MTKMVWCAIDFRGGITEIFKSKKAAFASTAHKLEEMSKSFAISEIRYSIFYRQNGICINCPNFITWAGMHLHEKKHRGQGGTYSLENDEGLCADCHLRIMHPEKQLNFGKKVK